MYSKVTDGFVRDIQNSFDNLVTLSIVQNKINIMKTQNDKQHGTNTNDTTYKKYDVIHSQRRIVSGIPGKKKKIVILMVVIVNLTIQNGHAMGISMFWDQNSLENFLEQKQSL